MLSVWPAGISTLYLVVVRLRIIWGPPAKTFDHRLPPMKLTLTASGSSFVMERRAWVAWPLISLIPKISEDGKDVEIFIFSPGRAEGFSISSSAYWGSQ